MAHPDLARIFDALYPLAQEILRKRGQFIPFGMIVDQTGTMARLGSRSDAGKKKKRKPIDVMSALMRNLRAQAERQQIRACGICVIAEAKLPGHEKKVKTICCVAEHANGDSSQTFVPYRRNLLGRYKFESPIPLPRQPTIFKSDQAVAAAKRAIQTA